MLFTRAILKLNICMCILIYMMHTFSHRKIPDWGHVVWEENYMLVILQRAQVNKKNQVVQSG